MTSKPTRMRCAIYERKSTEEGLDQEFNSLDAQRESAEAYIKSQAHEGWEVLPQRYSDGGYSGGNMDRPGLERMIEDIKAGKIDAVIVYKVDRLSRSLLDFARLLELFEKYHVAFISVTQAFNTSNSMGRLMLNVLLSFAQFEREIISERTRDKIAATRRKGKWSGGKPILGYDVVETKLIVNADEAARVVAIFGLYLELQSLLAVVQELERRGWRNKEWMTRKKGKHGGKPFTKVSLHKLLTNPAYIGKVKHKKELHTGEHAAIVDLDIWQRVQTLLQRNGRTGGSHVRNKYGALLKGILRCGPCDRCMSPSHTTRKGNVVYRYYVCCRAMQRGWDKCPSKSIPAEQIEQFVVDQIRRIGNDPDVLRETLNQLNGHHAEELAALGAEKKGLQSELRRWNNELRDLVGEKSSTSANARLADLQERILTAERRLSEVNKQVDALGQTALDEPLVATALRQFDPLWEALTVHERVRIIQLLIETVEYDGKQGKVSITFKPSGIKAFTEEVLPAEKCA